MVDQEASKRFDEALETLKEESVKSKEYYKFIIGLATGTLVFSVTFLKGVIDSPEYKIILIAGWVCLLISIVAGVLVLPKGDSLRGYMKLIKDFFESPEKSLPILKKELRQDVLKSLIKGITDPVIKDDEKKKKEFDQFLDKLPAKNLEKFFNDLQDLQIKGIKDPEGIHLIKELTKEILKCAALSKIVERQANPIIILKHARRLIVESIWLDRVMKYAFFGGIFAISTFAIINFLK